MNFANISWKHLPITKVIADSVGTNDQCCQESALVPSEMEQLKNVKGSLNSPAGYFDDCFKY